MSKSTLCPPAQRVLESLFHSLQHFWSCILIEQSSILCQVFGLNGSRSLIAEVSCSAVPFTKPSPSSSARLRFRVLPSRPFKRLTGSSITTVVPRTVVFFLSSVSWTFTSSIRIMVCSVRCGSGNQQTSKLFSHIESRLSGGAYCGDPQPWQMIDSIVYIF